MSVVPTGSVIIADDDADVRELVAAVLSRAGFRTESHADGVAALAAARVNPPHVLVLDVRMPEMGGLEVCRRVKADPALATTPVLLMSSDTTDADIAAGRAAGADDYLNKPFSPKDLVRRVGELLEKACSAAS